MRRAVFLVSLALCAVVVAGVAGTGSDGGDGTEKPRYVVMLDNTFGLTEGADLRVAGVKVGQIKKLELEVRSISAKATVEVDKPEFGGLRKDAFCVVEPQSLIGEYFMDCQPGRSPERLADGGVVPVEQTAGTIQPDLVAETLRRPYRERLTLLLSELGAGFAARGGDVNESIRRAIPALRETSGVLAVLAEERKTLAQLARDSETTLGALAGNRNDVARFVAEARDTAEISANRRSELATTIRRLPAFQRALRPALRDLGEAARRQTPALRTLGAAAPNLTTLLDRLGPFATASGPAIRALGRASTSGTTAVRDARGFVSELRQLSNTTLEPVRNLRFILEHLDDRENAVEPNAQSPTGKGFTAFEAIMQYLFNQTQAINLFSARGYNLKLGLQVNECGAYTDGTGAKEDPERAKRCSAALGPGGPVDDTRDPRSSTRNRTGSRTPGAAAAPSAPAAVPAGDASPAPSSRPAMPALPSGIDIPGLGRIPLPGTGGGRDEAQPSAALLEYLLG